MAIAIGGKVLVGLGQWYCSTERGQILVVRSVGTTAVAAVWGAGSCVCGVLHWMLPDSRLDSHRARRSPGLFADTGLRCLLAELESLGARRESLRAVVAGCASMMETGEFDVGGRNRAAARQLLARAGIPIEKEETGGVLIRNLELIIGGGAVQISAQGA